MGQYLIDNNVIANFFSERLSQGGMNFISEIIDQTPVISVITEIEALCWVSPDENLENAVRQFINDAEILALTPAIVKECIKIRRSKKIKTPDAIIAGTAIIHGLSLITSDKYFSGVKGLRIIDPKLL